MEQLSCSSSFSSTFSAILAASYVVKLYTNCMLGLGTWVWQLNRFSDQIDSWLCNVPIYCLNKAAIYSTITVSPLGKIVMFPSGFPVLDVYSCVYGQQFPKVGKWPLSCPEMQDITCSIFTRTCSFGMGIHSCS